jgi:hypothetical protein
MMFELWIYASQTARSTMGDVRMKRDDHIVKMKGWDECWMNDKTDATKVRGYLEVR